MGRGRSRLLWSFVILLSIFGWLADRAFVAQRESAEKTARAEAEKSVELASQSVRAELARIELAVATGAPADGVHWVSLAPEPRLMVPQGRPKPYRDRSRSELLTLVERSRASAPSGLPEAVVAAVALGASDRKRDVAGRLLEGELPVRREDLDGLRRLLEVGPDRRYQELGDWLARAPSSFELPAFPEFGRRLRDGGRIVSGWTLHRGQRLGYEISKDDLLSRAGALVAFRDGDEASVRAQVPDLSELTLRFPITRSGDEPSVAMRGTLWLAIVVALVAGIVVTRAIERERRAVDREKAFLANVTHELRSPLAAIRLFGETLSEGRGDPEAYGRLVARESERLEDLVEQILASTRTEQAPRFAPTRPRVIVEEATRLLLARAERRGILLTVEVDPNLPENLEVLWDESAIRRALVNLLDNAIKFGKTAARVNLRECGSDIRIEVRDDGPGVARRNRARVFGRFERGDTETPGTGLGLHVVEQAARAHGGRVDLETREGEGATFSLVLPAAVELR